MKQALLLLFFLCLFFLSCQPASVDAEDQSKLFAEFYLRLVEDEPLVKGEARFFEGDSLPTARPRTFKQVMLNNQLMAAKELKIKGTSYRGSLRGSADSIYTFSFINAKDEQQSHQIPVAKIDAFLIKDGWRKSTGMTIVWKGPALDPEEQLLLLFTDKQTRSTILTIDGPTPWSEVTITTDQLKDISVGKGSLYLIRKTRKVSIGKKYHFINRVEFFTKPLRIDVKE